MSVSLVCHEGEIVFTELLVVGWDCPRMGANPFTELLSKAGVPLVC